MKQDNLMAKYGITGEELKKAVDQIKLGYITDNTSVMCALADLLVNGDIEGSADSAPVIIFAGEEHKQFYYGQLETCRANDRWHRALFYTLGILKDCRDRIRQIYNADKDRIKPECFHAGWVTGTSSRVLRLASYLFTDHVPQEEWELYTFNRLFDNYDGYMPFYAQAITIRFA